MNIVKVRSPRNKVGFFVRTKDRVDISRQTLPQIFKQQGIDVLWVDDSDALDAKELFEKFKDLPGLCELHHGTDQGQFGSFTQGLKWLFNNNFDYIGFIDGDVLLQDGWFDAMLEAWKKAENDGLKVGAASARCIENRILLQRNNYAIMCDIGGGMAMYKKSAFLHVVFDSNNSITTYKQFKAKEISKIFQDCVGMDYPMVKVLEKMTEDLPPPAEGKSYEGFVGNDWLWTPIILQYGFASIAPTPSMGWNIDEEGAKHLPIKVVTKADPNFDFEGFKEKLKMREVLNI